jgi:regulator of sigma E protease
MNILITVVSLSVLVFVHELGHFLVALWNGVRVETFSIGFGPKIFSFERRGIVFKIAMIPFGGFVRMHGESPDDLEDNEESDIDIEGSFFHKRWWQKGLIALAGPVLNFVFAFLLITLSFMVGRTYSDFKPVIYSAEEPYTEFFPNGTTISKINSDTVRSFGEIYHKTKSMSENDFLFASGETVSVYIESNVAFFNALRPVTSNVVGEVTVGLPAWKAGIQSGDIIAMIDGRNTRNWEQVRSAITNSQNESVIFTIIRGEGIHEITLYPELNPLSSDGSKIVGITQKLDLTYDIKHGIFESLKLGSISTISFIYFNYHALIQLVQKPAALKDSVGGPIMVYYMTSQSTQRGLSDFLLFIAAISIILAIMNLLPIPVLDGGHIIFSIYEGIARKPLPLKAQMIAQQIGFLMLIGLMVFAFYSDISRLIFKV